MLLKKRAISTVAAIVVVVIVVAAVVGGVYYMTTLGTSSTTSSTSSSHSATTTAPMSTSSTSITSFSTSTSAVSVTTSTTSTTCTETEFSPTIDNVTIRSSLVPLFGNIPQLSMNFSMTSQDLNLSMLLSYRVVSTTVLGGVTTYKVNISSSLANATVWVKSDGTIPLISDFSTNPPTNYNGTTSPTATEAIASLAAPLFALSKSFLNLFPFFSSIQFNSASTIQRSFGPTTMQVTDFEASNLPVTINCPSATVDAFSMESGTVPSTNLTLVTYGHWVANFEEEGVSVEETVEVTSIVLA